MLQCLASALWDAEGSVYDVMRVVQVTVGGVRGDIDGGVQLRCACGIVGGLNMPHSGGGSVTVTGLQLRAERVHSEWQLVSEPCVTSSWQSSTSLACLGVHCAELGGESMATVEVTVGGFVGTGLEMFSFDAPVASDVLRNAPLTGDGSVTVTGLSFGLFEYTATAALGSAACSTTSWIVGELCGVPGERALWVCGVCGGDCGCMTGTGAAVHTYDPGRAGVFSFDAPVGSG